MAARLMITKLLPSQKGAVRAGALRHPTGIVLQMPTGAGKTTLAELAIADVLAAGRRAIYVAPLRALAAWLGAAEHTTDWRPVPLTWTALTFKSAADKRSQLASAVQANVAAEARVWSSCRAAGGPRRWLGIWARWV